MMVTYPTLLSPMFAASHPVKYLLSLRSDENGVSEKGEVPESLSLIQNDFSSLIIWCYKRET
jgi:hypothetical protein